MFKGLKNYFYLGAAALFLGLCVYSFTITRKANKYKTEYKRVESNYLAMSEAADSLEISNGTIVYQKRALELKVEELETSTNSTIQYLRKAMTELGVKNKELQSASLTTVETTTSFEGEVRDSIRLIDSAKIEYLSYKDNWITFYYEKELSTNLAKIDISTQDTAYIIVYEEKEGNWTPKNFIKFRSKVYKASGYLTRPNSKIVINQVVIDRPKKCFISKLFM